MKKYIVLLVMTSFLIITGCKSDLSDIEERLDDHDKRLLAIETKIKSANVEIKNLDGLIKGQEEKLQIVSHTQLEDKSGYKMIMSDGSEIILKNENKSLIGVKKFTDGSLYWTINGDFMLDADSKMIQAEGVTPKLRVNTDNEWEISSDLGKTWQSLLDEKGNAIPATGKDGKQVDNTGLKIEEKGDAIVIVYNGVTYKIKKAISSRPKLPIEYLTEYNVNVAGDGFVTSHKNDDTGHFNWYQLTGTADVKHNSSGKNIVNQSVFKGYHAPNHKEWRSIVPDLALSWETGTQDSIDISEEITVAGKTANYTADYNIETKYQTCYALRFKGGGNKLLSAYKYEYMDSEYDTGKMMRITTVFLGSEKSSTTINDVSKESFWDASKDKQIIRILPASGYIKNGEVKRKGEQGFYLSSDLHPTYGISNDIIMSMNFYETYLQCTVDAYGNYKNDKYAIRLFSNK